MNFQENTTIVETYFQGRKIF